MQCLRGLAALAVVLHHATEECAPLSPKLPDWLVLFGAAGVDVFFVLSGFLMVYTTDAELPGLGAAKRFLSKRFLRIFPPYWGVLALILLLHACGLYRSVLLSAGTVMASLALLPAAKPIVGVSWTLSYEIYFYLLFAACLTFTPCKRRALMVSGALAVILALASIWSSGSFLASTLTLEFAFGMLIADLRRKTKSSKRIAPFALGMTAIAGLAAGSRFGPHHTTAGLDAWRFALWGCPAALLVLAATLLQPSSRLLRLLGDVSYSLYLTHPILMTGFAYAMKHNGKQPIHALLAIPLLTALCILMAIPAHRLLERNWRTQSATERRESNSRRSSASA